MKIEKEKMMDWNFQRVAGALSLMLPRLDFEFSADDMDLIIHAAISARELYTEDQIDTAGTTWFDQNYPDELWNMIPENLRGELVEI